jgi:hypothetical protein
MTMSNPSEKEVQAAEATIAAHKLAIFKAQQAADAQAEADRIKHIALFDTVKSSHEKAIAAAAREARSSGKMQPLIAIISAAKRACESITLYHLRNPVGPGKVGLQKREPGSVISLWDALLASYDITEPVLEVGSTLTYAGVTRLHPLLFSARAALEANDAPTWERAFEALDLYFGAFETPRNGHLRGLRTIYPGYSGPTVDLEKVRREIWELVFNTPLPSPKSKGTVPARRSELAV